jgi:hypothetical protein
MRIHSFVVERWIAGPSPAMTNQRLKLLTGANGFDRFDQGWRFRDRQEQRRMVMAGVRAKRRSSLNHNPPACGTLSGR